MTRHLSIVSLLLLLFLSNIIHFYCWAISLIYYPLELSPAVKLYSSSSTRSYFWQMTPIAILRQGRKKRAQNEFSRFPRWVPTAKWAGTTQQMKIVSNRNFLDLVCGKNTPHKSVNIFSPFAHSIGSFKKPKPCCPIKYSSCSVCSSTGNGGARGGVVFFFLLRCRPPLEDPMNSNEG